MTKRIFSQLSKLRISSRLSCT